MRLRRRRQDSAIDLATRQATDGDVQQLDATVVGERLHRLDPVPLGVDEPARAVRLQRGA